ncbi:MAG TPA: FAD-binding oxidoreductase [Thermoanaerobaculia bacterium]|nr:FAD-binding oxidoreductase [Thermoanaerobaculia bacterium]
MRRWNGWGDETVSAVLPARAVEALSAWVGPGTPPRDATPAESLVAIAPSRLAPEGGLTLDPWERLLHARGQSLPDWIALRCGRIGTVPDAVAFPETGDAVASLLAWARERDARLIPYGGGTSVAGHVTPQCSAAPVVTIDLTRLSRLVAFDETSRLATFGAGVKGPDLEAELRARGFTLGHFPQSFELSTLGGWIATRSSGQQSLGYGRIERLFAGGSVETPAGRLDLPPFPASAAGPDLRELVLGSEGRLGVLTEGTVRVSPVPVSEEVHGVFLPDFPSAIAAVRDIAAMRLPLSMLRLSTPEETRTTLLLAGHERLIRALETYLSLRGAREEKCLLLVGISGSENLVRQTRRQALGALAMRGGVAAGKGFGREWNKNRFRAPYLRNALWEAGWAVDTLETAAPWSRVPELLASVETALRTGLAAEGERVHAFTHLSHVYLDGSSLYTTYLFRLAADPDVNLARWRTLKTAASDAIVAGGGTISHQHGVGTDHAPWLAAEKGELGIRALSGLLRTFDPDGLLNPGKLVP